jgi:hypothetical protein
MPSPFPGMDPWLEARGLFPDLHTTFIAQLREAINFALPRPYYTALSTRLYVDETRRHIEPDVDVLIPRKRSKRPVPAGGTAILERAEPLVLRVASDPVREWTLEIRQPGSGDRLVTSVEILSLSNKTTGSKGRKKYLRKRKELMLGRVNIVEIDLLRAGKPTTLAPLERVYDEAGPFEYHACTRRYYRTMARETYPIRMVDRLPLIAIPLLKGDADVTVDLQPVLDKSYDIARFDQRADYAKPPQPPLTAEQQAWAEGILKSKGVLP